MLKKQTHFLLLFIAAVPLYTLYLNRVKFSIKTSPFSPFVQVVGSSMQLIGDHQVEDRQLISEVVQAKMNQALVTRSASVSRSPARSPQGQKPTTVQPQQVRAVWNATEWMS